MTEVNNKNYGTIEKQFEIMKNYVIDKDPINLAAGYSGLNINENLKNLEGSFGGTIVNSLFTPLYRKYFHCLNEKNNKEGLINFIFGFGQNNFDEFLNNKQIDAQDKFFALVTKYAIISQLPEEFKDTRDKEMDLLYSNIEEVSKNYTEYIKVIETKSLEGNFILAGSLPIIASDILNGKNRTNYNKDVKFITNIYKNIPILTKDRIINYQGEPGFNRLLHGFLGNPRKNDDMLNFFKDTIQNDPTCIYKFSTTSDIINRKYEQIEKNKDFSGNFICNFPNALDGNGEINCEETRCKYNVLSDILYTLNYVKLPEDVREDVKQMANFALKSLSDHIKSLRDSENKEELQKINYLLNCPIEDPNTEEIVTPMDLINNLVEKGIINLTEEQKEQFKIEPVCLQTVEEVKNSIEFKIGTHDKIASKDIEKINNELLREMEKTESTMTYKVFNFFSEKFLGRKTKYKTNKQIMVEEKLNKKVTELSEPIFSSAAKEIKQQTSKQNISRPQSRQEKLANRGNSNEIPFP